MSTNSTKTMTSQEQRAKRKALLVAKIYAERELISLQAQRITNDVKPSTIKANLIEGAVAKIQGTKVSHSLFGYIERHPRVSWAVAQFLMSCVNKTGSSRSSWWRPLAIGAATWFVSSRRRQSKRPANAQTTESTARLQAKSHSRVRAESKPIKFVNDGPSMTRGGSSQEAPRPSRRLRRRRTS